MSTIIEFRGAFRQVASDGDRLRGRTRGTWFCRCGTEPIVERNNPKCDTCSRGGNCGLDCTVSKLLCSSCGQTA